MDIRLIASTITSVSANALSKQLFYRGDEGVCFGQIEAAKGDVRGRETARQGGGVVRLRSWGLLLGNLGGPEGVCDLGLGDAVGRQVRVGPGDGAVAILFRPVALSRGRPVRAGKG